MFAVLILAGILQTSALVDVVFAGCVQARIRSQEFGGRFVAVTCVEMTGGCHHLLENAGVGGTS